MTEPLAIEFIDLSEADARKIWHKQTKRAANFDKFLMTLNARSIGAAFDLAIAKISGADTSEEYAKEVKHNFNEAAKERTEFVDCEPHADGAIEGKDGKWRVERPAPVVIRWKASSHAEKRTVQDGKVKKEIDITVVDFLHGLIVASDTVKKRGPRATASEQVDALVSNQKLTFLGDAAKTVALADGRTATRTKAGHWRAPKLNTVAATTTQVADSATAGAASSGTENVTAVGTSGTTDATVRSNGQTVEAPVSAA